jgi:hypothetical protein
LETSSTFSAAGAILGEFFYFFSNVFHQFFTSYW